MNRFKWCCQSLLRSTPMLIGVVSSLASVHNFEYFGALLATCVTSSFTNYFLKHYVFHGTSRPRRSRAVCWNHAFWEPHTDACKHDIDPGMPSGHTQLVAAVCMRLAAMHQVSEVAVVFPVALMAYSRVKIEKCHKWSEVVVGGMVGVVLGGVDAGLITPWSLRAA